MHLENSLNHILRVLGDRMHTVSCTDVKYFVALIDGKWRVHYATFEKFTKEPVLELKPARF
jgi:hypothetical protein